MNLDPGNKTAGLLPLVASTSVQPRILIVDDEPANRRLLAALVKGEGCAIVEASGGAEALEIIAREPFARCVA
jgi:CheY-like chemotaxis protein